jgi:hypothetical protein
LAATSRRRLYLGLGKRYVVLCLLPKLTTTAIVETFQSLVSVFKNPVFTIRNFVSCDCRCRLCMCMYVRRYIINMTLIKVYLMSMYVFRECLTVDYQIDPNRLYATYFQGDESQGLAPDLEAKEIWLRFLPASRIIGCGCKDNFW